MERLKYLMCPPQFYEVDYVINPWMEGNVHKSNADLARKQWQDLYNKISQLADVYLIEPHKKLPDMVFTANAGLVKNGKAVVSKFTFPERQGEEIYFKNWFEENYSKEVLTLSDEVTQEGAGDALFQRGDDEFLWGGYGFRSTEDSYKKIGEWLNTEVVTLHLVDPRFYHLDTAFCPLENGYLMYFPGAFDEQSLKKINERVSKEKQILVEEKDAVKFACNAVNIGDIIVMNDASQSLEQALNKAGFTITRVNVPEFLKAGGATKCLTLRLE